MDKVLTIVVPAYNAERYLDKCLASFVLDPATMERLDVIVVNDGSTDGTMDIAEGYANEYPMTFRAINKENGGHGSTINVGSKVAMGKYLKVVDADDWILTESLVRFLGALEATEADVVLTHYHTIDITTGQIRAWETFIKDYSRAYTLQETLSDWKRMDRCLTFHGMTYRTEFYNANGYKLSEHVFYEDHEYATFACSKAQTIQPLDIFLYQYRIGDICQSVSDASQLRRLSHTEAVLTKMASFLRDGTVSGSPSRSYVARKTAGLLLSYYATLLLKNPNKVRGRRIAASMQTSIRLSCEDVYRLVAGKYRTLLILNRFRIGFAAFQLALNSSLYNRLRKNFPFDKEFQSTSR